MTRPEARVPRPDGPCPPTRQAAALTDRGTRPAEPGDSRLRHPRDRRRTAAIAAPVLAVLLVVAALGWLLAPAAPEVHGAATERFAVRLTVPTRSVEPWTVEVDGPDGRPAAVDVVLEPVMTGMGHALAPVAARPESTGRYRADVALPMAGQWEITVRLRDGVGAERAVFTVLR